MPTAYFLNGPIANLHGLDATGTYGREDFTAIHARCHRAAEAAGLLLDFRQTNDEGELIDWVQEARGADGLLINATSLSYTSIAVMDAMLMLDCPVIEIHMSNIHRREEPFRDKTFTSLAATASICGLGARGYELAIGAMAELIAGGRSRR
ncbi:MAG: 3-dehydroquinate dehydratase [Belnapia sp.]|nr:3-dehydroquinate dehydratase [Belnapia sp.]